MTTLIRAGKIFDARSPGLRDDAWLLVRRGRIAAVGDEASKRSDEAQRVFDLRPFTLMPGLIDSHVHLIWSGGSNAIAEARDRSDSELRAQALLNLSEAIGSGVTAVRDCGARAGIIRSVIGASDHAGRIRPRIVSCGAPLTSPRGHCWFLGLEARGRQEILRKIEEMGRRGVDFIKVMVTGGGSTPGTNVRRSQFRSDELEAVVEAAGKYGLQVTGHAHGTEGIRKAVRAGFTGIEHCSWLGRRGNRIAYDRRTVRLLVDRGVFVCRTIAGFERWRLEDIEGMRGSGSDQYGSAHRAFEALRRMAVDGVRLIAGTDAGIDRTDFSGLATSLETMVGLGGMKNVDVLLAATRTAAEALGLGERLGTLEVGRFADLIAVDGDPLDDIRALRRIRGVVKGGEPVSV